MRFYDTTKQGHAQVLAKHDCAKELFLPKQMHRNRFLILIMFEKVT